MLDGPTVVAALKAAGVTHVVWIPDSELGRWEPALRADPGLRLIRVSREGEGLGVAAGLILGGARPVVVLQCTGLFEAGDALRNVVHDLKLPLFLIVGLRGHVAAQKGPTADTCPRFAEPILRAWQIPYHVLGPDDPLNELTTALYQASAGGTAQAVLVPE
jgi:sulfopyruvate decarboxylase TPP-binding subunit